MKEPQRGFVIGIDPGRETGVAVWDRVCNRFLHLFSTDFWGCFDWIQENMRREQCFIYIEDATLIRGFFDKKTRTVGVGSSVGMVRENGRLMIEGLRKRGYLVIPVSPAQKGAKWKADYFKQLTGYAGRTNQHVRDAAHLCWKG